METQNRKTKIGRPKWKAHLGNVSIPSAMHARVGAVCAEQENIVFKLELFSLIERFPDQNFFKLKLFSLIKRNPQIRKILCLV